MGADSVSVGCIDMSLSHGPLALSATREISAENEYRQSSVRTNNFPIRRSGRDSSFILWVA